MTILLCTLGLTWAVIPEAYSFLAPKNLDLYRNHPRHDEIQKIREKFDLEPPEEIWVLTTDGPDTLGGLSLLAQWWAKIRHPGIIRAWKANGTKSLSTGDECERFRELALRAVLLANQQANGNVVLSLAGGRKTMSADLQRAGSLLGCRALIHITADDGPRLPRLLTAPTPEDLSKPLPECVDKGDGTGVVVPCAGAIAPLVVSRGHRSDVLDVVVSGEKPVTPDAYPLPLAPFLDDPSQALVWPCPESERLDRAVSRREEAGGHLFANYIRLIGEKERQSNWPSLYRLPPKVIEALRSTPVSSDHEELLKRLPKADLHCHLGGVLDLDAQRRVAQSAWELLTRAERESAGKRVSPLLSGKGDWDWDWPRVLTKNRRKRGAAACALLVEATPELLRRNLYGVTEPRIALVERSPRGFAAYERPGELSGSALLALPEAVEPYVEEAYKAASDAGLTYVEWRGSPTKYDSNPVEFMKRMQGVLKKAANACPGPNVRFIVIADRRRPCKVPAVVRAAIDGRRQLGSFVVGLDLAGDEKKVKPSALARRFLPAFKECLPLTIHAGEATKAENVWEAAYHLHADRIGHGLTLAGKPELAAKFRDRGICLELCPSSNVEVVGYQDSACAETKDLPPYPLRELLELGVPVTLCTDNPGISRCDLVGEYVKASRMVEGITLWEALAMMRQAFVHAMAPAEDRKKLLASADATVFEVLSEMSLHT